MVRPKDMDGMLTPTKGPHGAHLDTSLITSAIRKRKGEWAGKVRGKAAVEAQQAGPRPRLL